MPRVGFEATVPVIERTETVDASDRGRQLTSERNKSAVPVYTRSEDTERFKMAGARMSAILTSGSNLFRQFSLSRNTLLFLPNFTLLRT
jgi:hypothetical protein